MVIIVTAKCQRKIEQRENRLSNSRWLQNNNKKTLEKYESVRSHSDRSCQGRSWTLARLRPNSWKMSQQTGRSPWSLRRQSTVHSVGLLVRCFRPGVAAIGQERVRRVLEPHRCTSARLASRRHTALHRSALALAPLHATRQQTLRTPFNPTPNITYTPVGIYVCTKLVQVPTTNKTANF